MRYVKPEERDWLRREIDRVKRLRLTCAEISATEYRIEHGIETEKNMVKLARLRAEEAALGPPPLPDGRCLALVNLGVRWTGVLRVRCSRRAADGRFCRTHARRRIGEVGNSIMPEPERQAA